ncbi:hypothetical protein P7B02_14815 [Caulobacter segnis]|uniref:hypothetical protein n=1 Tax=Caulobacter segnis TaxID=88688 RepID=UPI002410A067|nr:hypothetical protein [Caulobacter segnis]MDG2522808.1 hypothetical protein [Caulobacter segnis]
MSATRTTFLSLAALATLGVGAAQAQPVTKITELKPADLPSAVTALVKGTVPGITILEAQKKEREGRIYFDVEGKTPEGEIELDVMQTGEGAYSVVEIQRDIAWADAPTEVRAAAAKAEKKVEPVRVIESKQTDGSVIYELFAAGVPKDPSLEIMVKGGQVSVLKEVWPH